MERLVNVHEAKTQFSRLLEQVAQGEEIVIARSGKPVARLIPYIPRVGRRQPGGWTGKVSRAGDWDSEELNREIEALLEGQDD